MSYASPYLLSLGLTKSKLATVFIAGPLSGLIMQPLIGVLADNSTSRFGRRRPYMLLGSLVCAFAMLLLGFTRPVASVFTGWDNDSNDMLTIWLAVLSIFLIDFSINAVQAVDRALLVDTLPSSAQASGNAWAARMLGVGSVVGFFVGNINLPRILPFLGKSQLQVLSVVVSLLLVGGHLVTAGLVKERVLLQNDIDGQRRHGKSFLQELKDIWTNMLTLPRVIRQICIIQFFAWIAWFPVLFYSTIYIGDLYKRSTPAVGTPDAQAALEAEATRLGSRALFYSSLLSLLANFALPPFVTEARRCVTSPTTGRGAEEGWWERMCRVPRGLQVHLASLWAVSHLVFAGCMLGTFFTHSVTGATILITITGFSWAITQWAPFSLLAEAILTEPAPSHVNDAISIRLADARTPIREVDSEREVFLPGDASDSEDEEDEEEARKKEERRRVLGNPIAQRSGVNITGRKDRVSEEEEEEGFEIVASPRHSGVHSVRLTLQDDDQVDRSHENEGGLSSKAGIILGIHNVFIVIPQFLVTGLSAIVFAIFDPQKTVLPGHHPTPSIGGVINGTTTASGVDSFEALKNASAAVGDVLVRALNEDAGERGGQSNSVVYIFRFGGFAAAFAFVLCWRLARELRHR